MATSEPLRQYRIIDPFMTDIYGAEITDQMRTYGVLLEDSRAAYYVAIGQLELYNAGPVGPNNQPVYPVLLGEIFAPTLKDADTGKFFLMQAFANRLKLIPFDPQDRGDFDDPGDLTAIMSEAMV